MYLLMNCLACRKSESVLHRAVDSGITLVRSARLRHAAKRSNRRGCPPAAQARYLELPLKERSSLGILTSAPSVVGQLDQMRRLRYCKDRGPCENRENQLCHLRKPRGSGITDSTDIGMSPIFALIPLSKEESNRQPVLKLLGGQNGTSASLRMEDKVRPSFSRSAGLYIPVLTSRRTHSGKACPKSVMLQSDSAEERTLICFSWSASCPMLEIVQITPRIACFQTKIKYGQPSGFARRC